MRNEPRAGEACTNSSAPGTASRKRCDRVRRGLQGEARGDCALPSAAAGDRGWCGARCRAERRLRPATARQRPAARVGSIQNHGCTGSQDRLARGRAAIVDGRGLGRRLGRSPTGPSSSWTRRTSPYAGPHRRPTRRTSCANARRCCRGTLHRRATSATSRRSARSRCAACSACGSSSNLMRTGSDTPSPKAMASRWPSADRNSSSPEPVSADGRRHDLLVAFVGHAQREHGIALRQDGRVDFRRPLRDDAQRCAVLAAFLGDLGDGALARLEADARIGRHVAVRFLADQRDGHLPSLHNAKSNVMRQSTETTTLTISDGRPVSSRMVIGLPLTGTRKMRPSTCAMPS